MAHAISKNAKTIWDYLMSIGDENVTAAKIAEEVGMNVTSVNPCITAGLANRGYVERIPAQIEKTNEDGEITYINVKFIKLTDKGKAYDHAAALALDAPPVDAE